MSTISKTVIFNINSRRVIYFIPFLPVSSALNWKKTLSSSFVQFFQGVLEEVSFFRKKPNSVDQAKVSQ